MNTTDSPNGRDDVSNASELLDFEPLAKSSGSSGKGMMVGVVLALLLAGGAGAGWFFMENKSQMEAALGQVPLILPPAGEVKTRPDNPGGMAVPDRDKLVYGSLDGSDSAPKFERLLPPPETPIKPPSSPVGESAAVPIPAAPAAVVPAAPVSIPPAPVAEVSPPPVAPQPPAAQQAPVIAPAPTTPPPSVQSAKSGWLIQLSAVRTRESAEAEWARLSKANSDVLGGLEVVIQRADLGSRGIFFRVRGGYFADKAAAQAHCAELAKRKVGCLIVAP